MPRGMWCRQTTSGSRGWLSPQQSSIPLRHWTCIIRRSEKKNVANSPPRSEPCSGANRDDVRNIQNANKVKVLRKQNARDPMNKSRSKLENSLGWFVLVLLLFGCLLVMLPFVSAMLWAVVLSFSTWPLYRRFLKWLGGRRTLAALLLSLGMILVVLLPFVV